MFIASIYRVKDFCNEEEEMCSSESLLTTAHTERYHKKVAKFYISVLFKIFRLHFFLIRKRTVFFTCSLKDLPKSLVDLTKVMSEMEAIT